MKKILTLLLAAALMAGTLSVPSLAETADETADSAAAAAVQEVQQVQPAEEGEQEAASQDSKSSKKQKLKQGKKDKQDSKTTSNKQNSQGQKSKKNKASESRKSGKNAYWRTGKSGTWINLDWMLKEKVITQEVYDTVKAFIENYAKQQNAESTSAAASQAEEVVSVLGIFSKRSSLASPVVFIRAISTAPLFLSIGL